MFLKIFNYIRKLYIGAIIMCLLCGIYIFIYKKIGFYYAANDDIVMQSLASGSATGIPEGHLIFIMYPFGKIVSGIFKLFPQYDWYGTILIFLMFLCYWMIAHRLLVLAKNKKTNFLIIVIGIIILISLIIDSAILFQFTVVSGVLASTAVFLIASTDEPNLKNLIYSLGFLIIAAIIRKKVFFMAMPLLVIIFFSRIASELIQEQDNSTSNLNLINVFKLKKKLFIKTSTIIIGTLLILGICSIIDDYAYSDEPWNTYSNYIHPRSLITDYYQWPSYEENIDFWDSLNISKEEYDCIQLYGILPDINEEKIEQIANYAVTSYYAKTNVGDRMERGWSVFFKAVKSPLNREWNILLLIAIIVVTIFGINKRDKVIRLEVLLCLAVMISEIAYLCYKGRLPYHVTAIIDYECVFAVLGLLCSKFKSGEEKTYKGELVVTIIFTGILCVLLGLSKSDSIATYKKNLSIYNEKYQYFCQYPDKFFILPAGGYVPQKKYTVHQVDNEAHNTAGTFIWPVYSPWMESRFSDYNIDRHSDYLLESNVYLLTGDLSWADKISNYYINKGIVDSDYVIADIVVFSDGIQCYLLKWYPASD